MYDLFCGSFKRFSEVGNLFLKVGLIIIGLQSIFIQDPLFLMIDSKLSRLKYSVNSIIKNIVQVPRMRLEIVRVSI